MTVSLLVGVSRFYFLRHFGYGSGEYYYFYYYSEALTTIGLYFALIGFYSRVLEELKAEFYVRLASILLLFGTALCSYFVVRQSSRLLLTPFVIELCQNLYFVGLILTYLLWGAVLKLRETRTQLIQLVLSIGVYFSLFAANYALRNLYPQLDSVWSALPPVFDCLLPLAWCYAFWRVPVEARLATSRLAVVPR